MKIWFFLLILLITSCAANLQDIRTSNPAYITTSFKQPKEVANCIAFEAQNEHELSGFLISTNENNGIYYVSRSFPGVLGVMYLEEVTVKPNKDKGSIIELRSTPHAISDFFQKLFIKIINKCASHKATNQE